MQCASRKICATLAVCAAILFSSAAGAQQKRPEKLAPSDIFRLQYTVDPQISPDGKRIVYVRQSANLMEDKRESNLWIVNFDGSDDRALTANHESDISPRWSPDGTRIAYLSDADGKTQIYIRWMDSGQTARLTDF